MITQTLIQLLNACQSINGEQGSLPIDVSGLPADVQAKLQDVAAAVQAAGYNRARTRLMSLAMRNDAALAILSDADKAAIAAERQNWGG